MNNRQLLKLGVPQECLKPAIVAIQRLVAETDLKHKSVKKRIAAVLESPEEFQTDDILGPLATAIIDERQYTPPEPITYHTWGEEDIDEQSHAQMRQACQLPIAVGAALMPDAHVGYGLPIGGVLACDNAVVPYAVGVDIACRMKLSVLDVPVETMDTKFESYRESLEQGTRFGVGASYKVPQSHEVMDRDWTITRVTRESKDKAWSQLGTSGSGNHFVEFGLFTLSARDDELGLEPGLYVALLSHSGSRGVGAAVCSTYSAIAQSRLRKRDSHLGRLAWLDLDSEAGQEYWAAMNLMGDYAAANHDVIHRRVSKLLGASIIAAWKTTTTLPGENSMVGAK